MVSGLRPQPVLFLIFWTRYASCGGSLHIFFQTGPTPKDMQNLLSSVLIDNGTWLSSGNIKRFIKYIFMTSISFAATNHWEIWNNGSEDNYIFMTVIAFPNTNRFKDLG
jgi:hypothetical protein